MGSSPVAVTAIFFSSYSSLLSLLHSIFSPFCSFLVFLLVLVLFLPSLFIHLFSDAPCCFLFKSSYPLFALPITLLFLLLPLVLFLFNLSSFCYSSSSESSIYTFFSFFKAAVTDMIYFPRSTFSRCFFHKKKIGLICRIFFKLRYLFCQRR